MPSANIIEHKLLARREGLLADSRLSFGGRGVDVLISQKYDTLHFIVGFRSRQNGGAYSD